MKNFYRLLVVVLTVLLVACGQQQPEQEIVYNNTQQTYDDGIAARLNRSLQREEFRHQETADFHGGTVEVWVQEKDVNAEAYLQAMEFAYSALQQEGAARNVEIPNLTDTTFQGKNFVLMLANRASTCIAKVEESTSTIISTDIKEKCAGVAFSLTFIAGPTEQQISGYMSKHHLMMITTGTANLETCDVGQTLHQPVAQDEFCLTYEQMLLGSTAHEFSHKILRVLFGDQIYTPFPGESFSGNELEEEVMAIVEARYIREVLHVDSLPQ